MTIAMCYMSPEGIVLGADSTSSLFVEPGGFHFFNHNQKLFEIGEHSTLGALTWGMGGLGIKSHRTLLAELSDSLKDNPAATVLEVAERWASHFWQAYSTSPNLQPMIQAIQALGAKDAYDPSVAEPAANARTKEEEEQFQGLRLQLLVGFCIAGYMPPNRSPEAYEVVFDLLTGQPIPRPIPQLNHQFWGAPNVIQRLIFGADDNLRNLILTSGKWNGTAEDLKAVIDKQTFSHVILPIRDAIDFVYACIYSTIKAMKFSNHSQICGGPIEIAVITTDRQFRWVRHKEWDAAVQEGMRL